MFTKLTTKTTMIYMCVGVYVADGYSRTLTVAAVSERYRSERVSEVSAHWLAAVMVARRMSIGVGLPVGETTGTAAEERPAGESASTAAVVEDGEGRMENIVSESERRVKRLAAVVWRYVVAVVVVEVEREAREVRQAAMKRQATNEMMIDSNM